MLRLTKSWKETYPGAGVGVLKLRGVANPESSPDLDARTRQIEQSLRDEYAGADRDVVKAIPTIAAYNDYYKRFKKTYHLQLQLESVLLKGKSVPGIRALVKAMVAAELKNQLLTAGHDVGLLEGGLVADVSSGDERYVRFGHEEQQMKAGDMYIADEAGIISSILYGPDARTSIRPTTEHACFTVYAVPGIEPATVEAHLCDIGDLVSLFSPSTEVELLEAYF